jgi:protein FAM50
MIRIELAKEWKQQQDKIKAESIDIQYSYHVDGKDQTRIVSVKKGISIQAFLELVKPEFKELKGVSTNDLHFVNKEFIVPQHHTLYDLLLLDDTIKSMNQKLFDFREKSENSLDKSPSTKIVERRWLEKNNHVYPYTNWKVSLILNVMPIDLLILDF